MTATLTRAFAAFPFPALSRRKAAAPLDLAEEDRSRRDFVNDVLTRCPECVNSDYGVGVMMGMFPGDF